MRIVSERDEAAPRRREARDVAFGVCAEPVVLQTLYRTSKLKAPQPYNPSPYQANTAPAFPPPVSSSYEPTNTSLTPSPS